MTKILLVPGLDGSGPAHWQAWWAATDPRAILLDWRDAARPDAEGWEAELAGAILHHPGALLVGHSLGAVTIARVLARWPELAVAGALLVAPADPSRSDRTRSFGPLPERRVDAPVTVVGSRNDPWLGVDRAAKLARDLDAGFVDLGYAGHINVDSGFGPWPRGKALAQGLLSRVQPSPVFEEAARPVFRPGDRRLPGAGMVSAAAGFAFGAAPSRATVWGRCYP